MTVELNFIACRAGRIAAKKSVWVVVVPLSLGILFFFTMREREPIVRGHSLTFWLDRYHDYASHFGSHGEYASNGAEAESAVRELGTNAIPYLLMMLQTRDNKPTEKLENLLRSLRLSPNHPSGIRIEEALLGFDILGAQARPAVPALVQLVQQAQNLRSKCAAVYALGRIGPSASEAVPYLLLASSNSDFSLRFSTVSALGDIRSQGNIVIPALKERLLDTNIAVRTLAARSLGKYGAEAADAMSALEKARGTVMGKEAEIALERIRTNFNAAGAGQPPR
jgi:HEAT repeat protein